MKKLYENNFTGIVDFLNRNLLNVVTQFDLAKAGNTSTQTISRLIEHLPEGCVKKQAQKGSNGSILYVPVQAVTLEIIHEAHSKAIQTRNDKRAAKGSDEAPAEKATPLFGDADQLTNVFKLLDEMNTELVVHAGHLRDISMKLSTLIGLWQPKEKEAA